jgi:hypothetical protein
MTSRWPVGLAAFVAGFALALVAFGARADRPPPGHRLPDLAPGMLVTLSYTHDGRPHSRTLSVEKVVPPPGMPPATESGLWNLAVVETDDGGRRTSVHLRPTSPDPAPAAP